ncbi:uncharacterized protein MONOS_3275 [Monocercomonoides exilis]|uniref:uncharacterized protein n=1 Tax=Monocercomonoides exilis TaxID=2049356 RepID=UPI00355995EC|nr:hypothetical protein MONOS_3275 [Monocercomonoides exilis]|eukprot:MONOS_3275.1-p1 / transcript=MONOS_3275.1 / gene=MONOS_3275 / organism=Monocercomonoides_exilis_PA203 / gene_product=unspecified product / transcript_product=unspecified product / location=Mono_scaffold00076:9598-10273(+) / protein_length=127 / sequence_SO=supercontig / SO=protein_coding / is_pseudo=false
MQNPHRRHSNHSLAAVSVSRIHPVLSDIRAALGRSTQTHLRIAAVNEFVNASSSSSSSSASLPSQTVSESAVLHEAVQFGGRRCSERYTTGDEHEKVDEFVERRRKGTVEGRDAANGTAELFCEER